MQSVPVIPQDPSLPFASCDLDSPPHPDRSSGDHDHSKHLVVFPCHLERASDALMRHDPVSYGRCRGVGKRRGRREYSYGVGLAERDRRTHFRAGSAEPSALGPVLDYYIHSLRPFARENPRLPAPSSGQERSPPFSTITSRECFTSSSPTCWATAPATDAMGPTLKVLEAASISFTMSGAPLDAGSGPKLLPNSGWDLRYSSRSDLHAARDPAACLFRSLSVQTKRSLSPWTTR